MCSAAAHVQANNISRGRSTLYFAAPPLTSVCCCARVNYPQTHRPRGGQTSCQHLNTVGHYSPVPWATATPLTQLLSSRTSHTASFFFSLSVLWVMLGWRDSSCLLWSRKSPLFLLLFCPCLMCAQGTYGRIISLFFSCCLPLLLCVHFFFCPCMYKVTGPYLTIQIRTSFSCFFSLASCLNDAINRPRSSQRCYEKYSVGCIAASMEMHCVCQLWPLFISASSFNFYFTDIFKVWGRKLYLDIVHK